MLVALPAFAAVAAFATLTALGTRTALTFHIAFGLGQKRLARQFELVGLGVYADQLDVDLVASFRPVSSMVSKRL